MKELEKSPELRATVVGAGKLHNRLQELKGTITGLERFVKATQAKTDAENKAKADAAALQAQFADFTGQDTTAAPGAAGTGTAGTGTAGTGAGTGTGRAGTPVAAGPAA